MGLKRYLSLLLAVVMMLSVTQTGAVKATVVDSRYAADEALDDDDADDADDAEDADEPDSTETIVTPVIPSVPDGKSEISNLSTSYMENKDTVALTYNVTSDCAYVTIYVNGAVVRERYTGTTYDFEQGAAYEFEEGKTYEFKVEAYTAAGVRCGSVSATTIIPFKQASVDSVDASYDLEQRILTVEWSGENIASAEIYQDNVPIAVNQRTGSLTLSGWRLDASSKHTYKVVPYNKNEEAGKDASYLLEVDDYVARIGSYEINYDTVKRQILINWEDSNTSYVSVYLNDTALAEEYTKKSLTANCTLQPGATYVVSIVPYNFRDDEGETAEEDVSFGDFEVPDQPSASVTSVPIKNSAGKYTGFTSPAVQVKWDAQERGVYEIYRAEKNTQSAYNWIATVTASKDGRYTYIDEKAGLGTYYYKIRRKIVEDDYLSQELLTSLSEEASVTVSVPQATLKATLNENGQILLTMQSKRDYVTGYEIYRKSGKENYKKIAAVTADQYLDEDIDFGKTYYYKVKAFYYDAKAGKTYGKYSDVSKVKNALGSIEAEVTAKSASTVKLTWTAAANAEGYEIYYRSGTQGDSYALLCTTGKLSYEHKTGKSGTHSYMIKAYQTTKSGKEYFSSAEVSIKMGFTEPKGFQVKSTSYTIAANTLTQRDTLTWNRVYGASGYYIDICDAVTGIYTRVAKISGESKTSYTLTNLVTPGAKTLKYRLSAYKGNSIKTGGTVEITPQLGTAKGIQAVASGSKVKVSWKGVTGAELYQVYRSNGRTMILVGQTNQTSITDQGLGVGVDYTYYVQAVSNTLKLTGAVSEPVSYLKRPAKISNLGAKFVSGGKIKLTWKAASNASGYVIYYKSASSNKYQKLAEVSAKTTSYEHKGLKEGSEGTCYYKVVAVQTNLGNVPAESKAVSIKVSRKPDAVAAGI